MTTLLGLSGALRHASTNTMLMRHAAELFGADTFVEGDIRLPLYDGDLETGSGIPAAVQTLADQISAADAVIIATPEYNKSIPGGLKNALDWISRTEGNPWADKPVAIMSAAAGRAGGERSQYALRHCLTPFRPRVLQGPEVLIGASGGEFDADGQLTNDRYRATLSSLMADLRAMT